MAKLVNKSAFFKQYGDSIVFDNISSFQNIFESLDITVEKRTHDHSLEELWTLMKFVENLLQNSPINLPCRLVKSSQPDILVEYSGSTKFGIEITESTDGLFIAALRLAAERGKGEWPVDSCFKYGIKPKSLEKTLQSPNEEFWGDPWLGEEGIRNTSQFLTDTIEKKLQHLNTHEYQGLGDVRLLIYFTAPSCIHTSDEQIIKAFPNIINAIFKKTQYSRSFSKFYLLWSRNMGVQACSHPYLVLTADSITNI
jgi:hypothetical protein